MAYLDTDRRQVCESSFTSALIAIGRLGRRVEEALAPIGLARQSYQVLVRLMAERPEGAGVEELAEEIGLPHSEVAVIVDDLVFRGLVNRVAGGVRGEASSLVATLLGESRALRGRLRLDAVLRELTRSFSSTERATLRRLLPRLVDRADPTLDADL